VSPLPPGSQAVALEGRHVEGYVMRIAVPGEK